MSRLGILMLLLPALLVAGACRPAPAPPTRRPDVLLVLVDDLSTDIGLYGGAARTPSLDRLAGRGRRFDRTYCQYPLCNPSRTSLFTGWRPERTRVWGNLRNPVPWVRQAVLLQDHFARHGYFTARVGKAYHSRFESEFRWSEVVDTYRESEDPVETAGWGPSSGDEEELSDVVAARNAVRILATPRPQPVFLVLGIMKPHAPWVVPERYLRLYPPAEVRLPASAAATPHGFAGQTPIPRERWPEAIAAYRAAATFADAQIGFVIDSLTRSQALERTIVVVVGDNGFHAAEHGLFGKATLHEAATRVPLVIAAPDLDRRGTPTAGLVELVDLYPTLLDLCDLPKVAGLDGVSLRPLLRDPDRSVKDAAFTMLKVGAARKGRAGRSVRTSRYRFTLWPDGFEELFDYETDPDEMKNLAAVPALTATRLALRRRLDELPPLVPAPAVDQSDRDGRGATDEHDAD